MLDGFSSDRMLYNILVVTRQNIQPQLSCCLGYCYLINPTLRRRFRWLGVAHGPHTNSWTNQNRELLSAPCAPLLPANLLRSVWERIGLVLVQGEFFKNQILCISTSDVLTTKVIIYFIDAIDSLGNYIYIFIDYNPLLRILRGEIHHYKI